MTFQFVPLGEADLRGSLLLAGLPAVGMEGAVAASFVAQRLDMRILGSFQAAEMPPIAAVRDGVATSPIQVWHAELACGPDGDSGCLLILKSDVPIPAPLLAPLAASVVEWAREAGVETILGLDTYTVREEGDKRGVLVATSHEARKLAEKLEGEQLNDSIIMGFTAALLTASNRLGLAAVGLFAPSTLPEAEVEGTTMLLESARPLLPELDLSLSELHKLVEEKSMALREERERQAAESRRMHDLSNRGYL